MYSDTIKLTFLGDVLCDYSMSLHLEKYQTPKGYDFSAIYPAPLRNMLKKSDYVSANLETPISLSNRNLTYSQWEFCSAFEFADALHDAGVNYVATANNHCLDRGVEGLEDTIAALDKIGLEHSGTTPDGINRKLFVKKIGRIRVGFLSYTYGTNAFSNRQYLNFQQRKCVDLIQEQEDLTFKWDLWKKFENKWPFSLLGRLGKKVCLFLYPENLGMDVFEKTTFGFYRKMLIRKDLKQLKHEADITVVNCHVGGQYNTKPSVLTRKTIAFMLENGADIVVCNHEHVVHSSCFLSKNNKLFACALGNFLASAGVVEDPFDKYSEFSIALHVYLDQFSSKIVKVSFSILKTYVNKDGIYQVWPVYQLLKCQHDDSAKKTLDDSLIIAKLFSGRKYEHIEEEFLLPESSEINFGTWDVV